MIRSARLLAVLALSSIACGGSDVTKTSTSSAAALSSDATLASLAVSAGTLSPKFASGTQHYALAVPFGVSAVQITPAANDPKAQSVGVRQDNLALFAVDSQRPSIATAVPAPGISSTLMVRVTAEDGTRGDYTIAFTQAAQLSSDSSLKALAPSAGTLVPAFSPAVFSYTLAVPNGTASLTLTPAANGTSIKLKQDGGAFGASTAVTVPAVGSSSTVTLEITAQDGTTSDYQIFVTQVAPAAPAAFTIYLIGDSTMADYDPVQFPDQAGWGQELRNFLVGSVGFNNAAKNGRSSKSYYEEGSWGGVKQLLKSGDFVIIQWAHNDEGDNGLEGPDGISTAPFGAYQTYLGKYVDETRAAGATPIFVTPIVRRDFDSTGVITPRGAHDLTGTGDPSIPLTQDLNYVEAMKQVATNSNVPVIDLTASTKQLVEQYGPIDSKSIIYIAADDTHIQPIGATLFAQLAAQEFISKGILADHFTAAGNLVVSPASIDYGTNFVGTVVDKVISVTGLSLSPDSGNITITAPAGYAVSATASGTFASTLQVPYTGGRLAPTSVHVHFAPVAAGTFSGSVTVAPQTGTPQSVSVTGVGLAATTGGTDTSVVYALMADDNCTTTGLATCLEETYSGLDVKQYSNPNTTNPLTPWMPATPAITTVQRVSIIGDNWPGSEVDVVPDRFVQFAVSPAAGKTWTLDSISLWAGAAGGSNMAFAIEYSTDPDFGSPTIPLDSTSNAKDTMVFQTFPSTLVLNPGDTLFLRVFPWLKGAAASGKFVCLQSLTIHGTAQ
jgi:lysophospholipase L1-like esterase